MWKRSDRAVGYHLPSSPHFFSLLIKRKGLKACVPKDMPDGTFNQTFLLIINKERECARRNWKMISFSLSFSLWWKHKFGSQCAYRHDLRSLPNAFHQRKNDKGKWWSLWSFRINLFFTEASVSGTIALQSISLRLTWSFPDASIKKRILKD